MAKLSALGRATTKTATKPASQTPVFSPDDLKDSRGEVIFTKAEIKDAIEKIIQSGQLADQAKALMTVNRPTVLEFARARLARVAVQMGRFPESSPKLMTDDKGEGSYLTAAFLDKCKNMTPQQFDELAEIIGQENAETWTKQGFEYGINNEMLEMELSTLPEVEETDESGKTYTRKQTYFDLLDSAVTEKFVQLFGEEKAGEMLTGFFTQKEIFRTKKGLLDMLPTFVGKSDGAAFTLAAAIKAANVEVQLKPGVVQKK